MVRQKATQQKSSAVWLSCFAKECAGTVLARAAPYERTTRRKGGRSLSFAQAEGSQGVLNRDHGPPRARAQAPLIANTTPLLGAQKHWSQRPGTHSRPLACAGPGPSWGSLADVAGSSFCCGDAGEAAGAVGAAADAADAAGAAPKAAWASRA